MKDTASRLRRAIEKMAERGQMMTFADDGDHIHPVLRFRLKSMRHSIDGQHRVMLEHLEWGDRAVLRRQRQAEDVLELEHVHYIGTKVCTLASLYAQGILQPVS